MWGDDTFTATSFVVPLTLARWTCITSIHKYTSCLIKSCYHLKHKLIILKDLKSQSCYAWLLFTLCPLGAENYRLSARKNAEKNVVFQRVSEVQGTLPQLLAVYIPNRTLPIINLKSFSLSGRMCYLGNWCRSNRLVIKSLKDRVHWLSKFLFKNFLNLLIWSFWCSIT